MFNDEILVEEGDFAIRSGSGESTGGRPAADSAVPLDDGYLDRHIGMYVRPGGFGPALDTLRGRHLLILCGPPGSGRESAAIALLAEAGSRNSMRMMAGSVLLAERGWRCGPAGTAFLVPSLPGDLTGRLDDVWLQKTAKLLRDSRNYMVVVTEEACGALAAAGSRGEFTFEELGLPDPLTLVRRRARALVTPARTEELRRWLASDEVAALLAEDGSPRFASRVAVQIADAVSTHKDRAATLQALLDPAKRVQAWFARTDTSAGTDYRQIVLPVAVSVLEDSSYLTISDAATALYGRLFPDLEQPPALRFRRALADQQQWIQLAEPPEPATAYGDPSPEVLRFRSPRLGAAVLQHTWTWVNGMRPALTGWLRDLGGILTLRSGRAPPPPPACWPPWISPMCCTVSSIRGRSALRPPPGPALRWPSRSPDTVPGMRRGCGRSCGSGPRTSPRDPAAASHGRRLRPRAAHSAVATRRTRSASSARYSSGTSGTALSRWPSPSSTWRRTAAWVRYLMRCWNGATPWTAHRPC